MNAMIPWNLTDLSTPPRTWDAPGFEADGVRALFYEGAAWRGKETRVFAYVGLPDVPPGTRVPGMVLLHGGGGTAFANWVRLWTSRGYAAISMDTCGCTFGGDHSGRPRHDLGGPPGWGGFGQIDEPIEDQWTYHAIAAALRGHSLLRSLPEVDEARIGVTGVSWGGYLTCITAGVDDRFRFAAPVYGCGFLGAHSAWSPQFETMGSEKARKWFSLWDPSVYLPNARLPMLWLNGTNDFAYWMRPHRESYRTAVGERTLSIRVRMPHGHGPAGENHEETLVFADSLFRGGTPLPRVTGQGVEGRVAWVAYRSPVPVVRAELNFTRDEGEGPDRAWEILPAALNPAPARADAVLPRDAKAFYLNLFDARGCCVSSEYAE